MKIPRFYSAARLSGVILASSLTIVSAQQLSVTNYADTKVVTYPLVLLRGTAPAAATSVTVTNTSSTRPTTKVMNGLARQGQFKAFADLVPGENRLVITSGVSTTEITLRYVPQTNPRYVRPMLYTLSSGDTKYPTPLAGDPQNWQAKLEVMVKLMQTFTAETMHDQGYPRMTFNLPIDPATGQVQTVKLVGEHDADYYYNTTYNRDDLWSEAYNLIDRDHPDSNAKDLVLVGFSKFDPSLNYKYAHTALGGGHLGLMGGLSMWAMPDSIADIQPTFMDGSTAFPEIQGEAFQVNLAATEIMGAALHELGHAFDRPHEGGSESIMQRGFDRLYRYFTLAEPNGATWPAGEEAEWSPPSAAYFASGFPWISMPPPAARWETVAPDPLPEPLGTLMLRFDQPVSGVTLSDFSLTLNGAPVAGFQSGASVAAQSSTEYVLNLGTLAAPLGNYELTLVANSSGITNGAGFQLYENRSRTWSRSASTAPQWNDPAAVDIGATRASLTATLATTGGLPTTLQLVYGPQDMGATTAGWANSISQGNGARGLVSVPVTGLNPNQDYYFRFSATNSLGTTWTPAASFHTPLTMPSVDVTLPGQAITGSSLNYPAGEAPQYAIDNLASTKYLNFDRFSSGFRVVLPEARTVRALDLISANDSPERDPSSYIVRGSNDGSSFTTLGEGAVSFPARFASARKSLTAPGAYRYYEVVFPTVASESSNSMQIGEVQLLEFPDMISGATITGTAAASSADEGANKLTDGLLETKMGLGDNQTQMLTITPATALKKHVLKGFNLVTANDNEAYTGRSPSSITLQGSSDGSTYRTLYTISGLPELNKNFQIDEHTLPDNEFACQKYRLLLGSAASGFMQVSELQMFGIAATGYHAWIAGFNMANPGKELDPDRDGASNEMEYLFDTSPLQSDSTARKVSFVRETEGRIALGFRAAAGRSYQPEYSDDLEEWHPAGPPVTVAVTNAAHVWKDDGTHTGSPPVPGTKRFYRFAVSAP